MTTFTPEMNKKREHVIALMLENNRDETIAILRKALKDRTGRTFSVRGGRGTAWGWIDIEAPPRVTGRLDREEWLGVLAEAMGLTAVHFQGLSIPASRAYYRLHIARALYGEDLGFTAEPYWD